ncbi:MAG: helix-turn-helix transcriptional regulator [Chloroflexota bacterium]
MLSELISRRRKELNMSVMDLANASTLTRAYIYSFENSDPSKKARQPTARVLVELARALSLPIAEVFKAAGINVADLPVPVDPQVSRLIELAQTDKELARIVAVWSSLTRQDGATIAQAAEDLAKLRTYLAEVERVGPAS